MHQNQPGINSTLGRSWRCLLEATEARQKISVAQRREAAMRHHTLFIRRFFFFVIVVVVRRIQTDPRPLSLVVVVGCLVSQCFCVCV